MRKRNLIPKEEKTFRAISDLFPDAALLYPSKTGLAKSIIDAHASIRYLLAKSGFHDFSKQKKGRAAKVYLPALVCAGDKTFAYDLSLYRPETKDGDPRIWPSIVNVTRGLFSKFKFQPSPSVAFSKICKPDDLFAVFEISGILVMVRLADVSLPSRSITSSKKLSLSGIERGFAFWYLLNLLKEGDFSDNRKDARGGYKYTSRASSELSSPSDENDEFVVREIVGKFKVHAGKYVESRGSGDMAVGKTVEWMLGVSANSSKEPDYKGIEIKSARSGQAKNKLTTLFSKTPDRSLSKMRPHEVILAYGWVDEVTGKRHAHVSVGSQEHPHNKSGFYTKLSEDCLVLEMWHEKGKEPMFVWSLEKIKAALLKKHRRTLWVTVDSRKEEGMEYFKVREAKLTGAPDFDAFIGFLKSGNLTVDLTMTLKENQKAVRDHGYLFRIKSLLMDKLFLSEPRVFEI